MKKSSLHFITGLFVLSLFNLLSACSNIESKKPPPHLVNKSREVSIEQPRPAILLESNSQNTEIIQQAMSFALKGRKVTLHKNAFLQSPDHTIEKKSFTQTDGLILDAPKANRFSLFIFKNVCYLTYDNGAKQIPLSSIECKPVQ